MPRHILIQIDMLHRGAAGQHIHIGIINIAPIRCYSGGSALVLQRFSGIVIILYHHQLVKPGSYGNKSQNAQQHRHDQNPSVLPGIQPNTANFLPHHTQTLSQHHFKWAARESLTAHHSC